MNPLLILHITLGTVLVIAFIARYVAVLARRVTPRVGRRPIGYLSVALVASGVLLSIVYKAPLTSACLSSLGIIALVVGLESVLQLVAPKPLPAER